MNRYDFFLSLNVIVLQRSNIVAYQTKDSLFQCFYECTKRFWPLLHMNDIKLYTYENDISLETKQSNRIEAFTSQMIDRGFVRQKCSHTPFNISEIRYEHNSNV